MWCWERERERKRIRGNEKWNICVRLQLAQECLLPCAYMQNFFFIYSINKTCSMHAFAWVKYMRIHECRENMQVASVVSERTQSELKSYRKSNYNCQLLLSSRKHIDVLEIILAINIELSICFLFEYNISFCVFFLLLLFCYSGRTSSDCLGGSLSIFARFIYFFCSCTFRFSVAHTTNAFAMYIIEAKEWERGRRTVQKHRQEKSNGSNV